MKRRSFARLLALDLDGTLLRRDGSISAATLGALRAAQARGITPLLRRADAVELCREGVTKLIVQQLDWPLPELLEMTRVFAS